MNKTMVIALVIGLLLLFSVVCITLVAEGVSAKIRPVAGEKECCEYVYCGLGSFCWKCFPCTPDAA